MSSAATAATAATTTAPCRTSSMTMTMTTTTTTTPVSTFPSCCHHCTAPPLPSFIAVTLTGMHASSQRPLDVDLLRESWSDPRRDEGGSWRGRATDGRTPISGVRFASLRRPLVELQTVSCDTKARPCSRLTAARSSCVPPRMAC